MTKFVALISLRVMLSSGCYGNSITSVTGVNDQPLLREEQVVIEAGGHIIFLGKNRLGLATMAAARFFVTSNGLSQPLLDPNPILQSDLAWCPNGVSLISTENTATAIGPPTQRCLSRPS